MEEEDDKGWEEEKKKGEGCLCGMRKGKEVRGKKGCSVL